MKKFIIPILTVLTIVQSCAPTKNDVVPDETAKKIFTQSELAGIERMIKFVDNKVSENENVTDVNQAYHTYFGKFYSDVSEGKMFPALVKDSVKFKFLETIDKDAFSSVWRMDDYVKISKYRDVTLTDLHGFKTLELNYQGKYLTYLKEIGKSDSLYFNVFKSIEIAGGVPPSIVGWYPTQHEKIDFNTFKDRLWATVFLLRMSDPFDERIERYLKNKNISSPSS